MAALGRFWFATLLTMLIVSMNLSLHPVLSEYLGLGQLTDEEIRLYFFVGMAVLSGVVLVPITIGIIWDMRHTRKLWIAIVGVATICVAPTSTVMGMVAGVTVILALVDTLQRRTPAPAKA